MHNVFYSIAEKKTNYGSFLSFYAGFVIISPQMNNFLPNVTCVKLKVFFQSVQLLSSNLSIPLA